MYKKRRKIIPAKVLLVFNLIFISCIFIIGFIPDVFNKDKRELELINNYDKNLSFSAFVCEEADVDYKSRRLVLCASSKVLITADLYPEYDYGDYLKISGKLLRPEKFNEFDYGDYLARYDIYSLMYYPKIEKLKSELSLKQKSFRLLLNIKQKIKSTIDKYIPEPESGLANAILLGLKRTVSKDNLEFFSKTGLSHLIAISGSHITILSALLASFLSILGFKKKNALRAVLSFLIIYPAITGLSASAVRSSVMGGLSFIAIFYKRRSISIHALLLSASIMLMLNPKLLRSDIGFQLSFLAVLGIIYLYPYGEAWFREYSFKNNLKSFERKINEMLFSAFNLTMVSQIMTLPILLINFHRLSIISPLANIIAAWVFAPILSCLIIATMLVFIFPSFGGLLYLPSYLFLHFLFLISSKMASWSFSSVEILNVSWRFGFIYYLILFIFIVILRRRLKTKDAS